MEATIPGATQSAMAVRGVGSCGKALVPRLETQRCQSNMRTFTQNQVNEVPKYQMLPRGICRSPDSFFYIIDQDGTKLPCQCSPFILRVLHALVLLSQGFRFSAVFWHLQTCISTLLLISVLTANHHNTLSCTCWKCPCEDRHSLGLP